MFHCKATCDLLLTNKILSRRAYVWEEDSLSLEDSERKMKLFRYLHQEVDFFCSLLRAHLSVFLVFHSMASLFILMKKKVSGLFHWFWMIWRCWEHKLKCIHKQRNSWKLDAILIGIMQWSHMLLWKHKTTGVGVEQGGRKGGNGFGLVPLLL